jgi:hypothetical protein
MKKIRLLSRKPLIWFHYVLLVGILFLAHWLSTNRLFNLETLTQTKPVLGWILIGVWYYVFFAFGDQLIHYILQVD